MKKLKILRNNRLLIKNNKIYFKPKLSDDYLLVYTVKEKYTDAFQCNKIDLNEYH